MRVYYNEFDKKKCAALYQLMQDGHITKGDIDDRSIRDVRPDDVKGYDRAHFFAGIGLWDYALNLAGWKKDTPVWTGSCPCQPFSTAGRQKGKADDRHLWPEWLRLIEECKPPAIYGEQVANAVAKGWLDDVYEGLEAQDYAVGSAVLPACSVGAPHKRDRLWFVGNAEYGRSRGAKAGLSGERINSETQGQRSTSRDRLRNTGTLGNASAMGNASGAGLEGAARKVLQKRGGERSSHWGNGVWFDCPDGKKRLVEPSISLLVDGDSERVGLIHAAGDAIIPQVAAGFIQATI